MFIMLTSKKDL